MEITEDYWILLEITGDTSDTPGNYWRYSRDYWKLLEVLKITEDYWISLEITGDTRDYCILRKFTADRERWPLVIELSINIITNSGVFSFHPKSHKSKEWPAATRLSRNLQLYHLSVGAEILTRDYWRLPEITGDNWTVLDYC